MRKFLKILLAIVAFTFSTFPAQSIAGEITRIEINGNVVVVHFDDLVVNASGFVLTGPDRIAIDVQGATAGKSALNGNGIVRSVRKGQYSPDTVRIVLDLDRPAAIASGRFADNGRSLILTLVEIGADESGSLIRGRKQFLPPANFAAKPKRKEYSVRMPLPKAKPAVGLPQIYGPDDDSRQLVVIDAGHGGHDPGTISPHGGKYEKDVTLSLAKALRDELVRTGRVRVALTRDTDEYLVLSERYGIARRMGADLFISVHADATGSHEANGATVYTLAEAASDRDAARLAARENKSDIINGVNLAGTPDDTNSILMDLTKRQTMNLSANFAKLVLREGKENMKFRSNSHRYASFTVLKAPDVPSILLMGGYMTNQDDLKFLTSTSGREAVASSVASAINIYFAKRLGSH